MVPGASVSFFVNCFLLNSMKNPHLVKFDSMMLHSNYNWLVGPPTKAMLLWLGAYICNWLVGYLAGYLAILLCLVVGFRPRFHSGHLAPSQL